MDALQTLQSELETLSEGDLTTLDLETSFVKVAGKMMTEVLVSSPSGMYWLDEMEFYFYDSQKCRDVYAHCHPRQLGFGNWYFHRYRSLNGFRRFSRNGLDLAFGSRKTERYGGILFRAITHVTGDRKIEGINRTAKALIEGLGAPAVDRLAFGKEITVFDMEQPLHLTCAPEKRTGEIVASHRKGLNPKVDRGFWEKQWNFRFSEG